MEAKQAAIESATDKQQAKKEYNAAEREYNAAKRDESAAKQVNVDYAIKSLESLRLQEKYDEAGQEIDKLNNRRPVLLQQLFDNDIKSNQSTLDSLLGTKKDPY